MSRSQRRAFTLIELLVILAILGFLLGLLLPAIQKMREAAARVKQTNNLRQVCLAVHTHHDQWKKLPPAFGTANLKDNKFGDYSISVWLLPYIEQQNLFDKIIEDKAAPTDVRIQVFNAPQDMSTIDFIRVQNFAANVRAFTDEGIKTPWDKTVTLRKVMNCNGTLPGTFQDGTSNTIAFATRYASAGTLSTNGKSKSPCGYYDLPTGSNGGSFFGATPMTGKASATSKSGWQLAPTLEQVNCDATIGMAHAFAHYGIVVGLADGSVRVISPSISSQTWNQALQPNDGNAPGADW